MNDEGISSTALMVVAIDYKSLMDMEAISGTAFIELATDDTMLSKQILNVRPISGTALFCYAPKASTPPIRLK
ncbi:hypothetical protein CLV59_107162 [Chitinophaga dinghuensis]|uniref:Uncharacterized protein n=1 Tax=Chitinophaga dinghuensis TaxID=1539050 RepID=A0A327VPX9_9BACT|nr:hypothetical protein [Chitinophaga dinghuensis]RAJ77395.1 hypothetical protein CLV59_107162 [Chitinophaga dinghuensis]